jgi:CubicO group peptidase (beta-lactamase class C family)
VKTRIGILFGPIVFLAFVFSNTYRSTFTLPVVAKAYAAGQSEEKPAIRERIQRVESGLLPPIIKGRTAPMNLAERMRFYHVPGVSIAVINNGVLEWARGYGVRQAGGNEPVTAETLFPAGFITQPVTAMAVMRLVQEGKLRSDEDINQRLISWKIPENEHTKERKVTLRLLLNQTSGLSFSEFKGYPIDGAVPTLRQLLEGLPPAPAQPVRVEQTPGTEVGRIYGSDYHVLQQLLIDVTGKPFPQLMQETVLDRLGMQHSTFQQPLPKSLWAQTASGHLKDGEPVKNGWYVYPEMARTGLWTTPSDLARFAIDLHLTTAGKSSRVLSAEMMGQMDQILGPSENIVHDERAVGPSKWKLYVGYAEGFLVYMVNYPNSGKGAVVMINRGNYGHGLQDEILRSIAKEYDWPDYLEEKVLVTVDPKTLSSYAGQYLLPPNFVMTIKVESDKLLLGTPDGPPRLELLPESESRFFFPEKPDMYIEFFKDEIDKITHLVWHINKKDSRLNKIK